MHRAAHLGEERLLQQLIAAGHSVNRTTYDNVTPLHDACLAGNTRCAVLLIDAGALVRLLLLPSLKSLVANSGSSMLVDTTAPLLLAPVPPPQ